MKFVVSTKSGKAYSTTTEEDQFVGKKIGENVKLDAIGLTGYEAKITGGSDKQGFPMDKSVAGVARKKKFSASGFGFKSGRKGERKRFSVRGNTISQEISQLNLLITKDGTKTLDVIFNKEAVAPTEEETMCAKERALKLAAETAGSDDIGDAPTKKGKH